MIRDTFYWRALCKLMSTIESCHIGNYMGSTREWPFPSTVNKQWQRLHRLTETVYIMNALAYRNTYLHILYHKWARSIKCKREENQGKWKHEFRQQYDALWYSPGGVNYSAVHVTFLSAPSTPAACLWSSTTASTLICTAGIIYPCNAPNWTWTLSEHQAASDSLKDSRRLRTCNPLVDMPI